MGQVSYFVDDDPKTPGPLPDALLLDTPMEKLPLHVLQAGLAPLRNHAHQKVYTGLAVRNSTSAAARGTGTPPTQIKALLNRAVSQPRHGESIDIARNRLRTSINVSKQPGSGSFLLGAIGLASGSAFRLRYEILGKGKKVHAEDHSSSSSNGPCSARMSVMVSSSSKTLMHSGSTASVT